MAKVTSKLQVTVPKAIADHYGIRPGDEIQWIPAGIRSAWCLQAGPAPVADLELTAQTLRRGDRTPAPAAGAVAGGAGSLATAGGSGRISTTVPALVDTNVLVYRFDPRFPEKQEVATELLRRGLAEDQVRIPHQAVVEFVAAVTRPLDDGRPLLVSRRRAPRGRGAPARIRDPLSHGLARANGNPWLGRVSAQLVRRPPLGLRRGVWAPRADLGGLPARTALRHRPRAQPVPVADGAANSGTQSAPHDDAGSDGGPGRWSTARVGVRKSRWPPGSTAAEPSTIRL